MSEQPSDAVQVIIQQWQKQGLPKESLLAMESIGRIRRLEVVLMRHLCANYKESHQLSHWEFDVLATLRRSGKPFILSPTDLFDSMMVSSGTMTNRLQHLEKKHWIRRIDNPNDKRSLLVQLTDSGVALIDSAMASHLKLENELLADMTSEELTMLNLLLKKLEKQLPFF